MIEAPLTTLARWEDFGALWRTKSNDGHEAVVELCSCHGEAVDELRSDDPELLRYLADRPTSEDPRHKLRDALAERGFDLRAGGEEGR